MNKYYISLLFSQLGYVTKLRTFLLHHFVFSPDYCVLRFYFYFYCISLL